MPSLLKSTAILAFARTTNFALVVFSPIFLVRILDPTSFGQYREFMVYAMLITGIAAFNKSNLLYFIPRDPAHTREYVSHTTLMTFVTSVAACLLLYLFHNILQENTSLNFVLPLIIYVFLFLNLDFLETYWIAKGQPDYVMYFSITRTVVRLSTVVGTAFVTKSVIAMIYALCAIEALRILVSALIMARAGILKLSSSKPLLEQQLAFVLPLGISGTLNYASQYVGQIAISAHIGVIALGIYTIANFQVPILNIVRGAIGDSIFPRMVREAVDQTREGLRLWKRANVAYTFLIIPYFAIVTWYADVLIPWIFTDKYIDAVPLFRVLALFLLTQCFEFSSPLRAIRRTRDLLAGTTLMLITNIAFILFFFRYLPDHAIFGPAAGIVAGNVVQTLYYGWRITGFYNVPISQLLKWKSLLIIVLCTVFACIPLLIGDYLTINDFIRLPLFSLLFVAVYYVAIRHFHLEEVETVIEAVSGRLRGRFNRDATSN
jgi:O-antigen/teichoic acid export membrane protein